MHFLLMVVLPYFQSFTHVYSEIWSHPLPYPPPSGQVINSLLFWNPFKAQISDLHPQFPQLQSREGSFAKQYPQLAQFITWARESTWLTFVDSKIMYLFKSLTENSERFPCGQQKRGQKQGTGIGWGWDEWVAQSIKCLSWKTRRWIWPLPRTNV